jgi:uncharacterized protein YdeI (YjbR/CyaY-like superfamily)
MGKRDARVDAYIARSADFAKPILNHIREVVHVACPEVEEAIKWTFPNFIYKGILCHMAAFKAHCTFGFWNSRNVVGADAKDGGMGQFGRITSLADLPAKAVLAGYVKKAAKLKDSGAMKSAPRAQPKQRKPLVVPTYFKAALRGNKKAWTTFDDFSYSHKKEYVQWVTEAKTEETRERRLQTALDWMAKGKSRNWKYARC